MGHPLLNVFQFSDDLLFNRNDAHVVLTRLIVDLWLHLETVGLRELLELRSERLLPYDEESDSRQYAAPEKVRQATLLLRGQRHRQ